MCIDLSDTILPRPRGLYNKYRVSHADGTPIAPGARYITLRIDDGEYAQACRAGVLAFARGVHKQNPRLSYDLVKEVNRFTTAEGVHYLAAWCGTCGHVTLLAELSDGVEFGLRTWLCPVCYEFAQAAMDLTESQAKGLRILYAEQPTLRGPGTRPSRFAELMWPDSPGHKKHCKSGPSGTAIGTGMNLSAGGYLGKLARRTNLIGQRANGAYYINARGISVVQMLDRIEDSLKPLSAYSKGQCNA